LDTASLVWLEQWVNANTGLLSVVLPILAGIGAWAYNFARDTRYVKHIVDPTDSMIEVIEEIQERSFPVDELDPPGLLAKRIAESNFDARGRSSADELTITVYHLRRGKIDGYLSSQYFPKHRTIFFWYIVHVGKSAEEAVDKDDVHAETRQRRGISIKLIRRMLRICDRTGTPWESVIAEVDIEKRREVLTKVRKFQMYSSEIAAGSWLARKARQVVPKRGPQKRAAQVFKVDVPFRMPLHDAGLLAEAESHESPGWLVFAPRNPARYHRGGEKYSIRHDEVARLIEALRLSYNDPGNPAYNLYVDAFFRNLTASYPAEMALVHRAAQM
jgi:hypothetical protein